MCTHMCVYCIGQRGIRTLGTKMDTSVFKTDTLNRSDIYPWDMLNVRLVYTETVLSKTHCHIICVQPVNVV
jgi:hypothetical protein